MIERTTELLHQSIIIDQRIRFQYGGKDDAYGAVAGLEVSLGNSLALGVKYTRLGLGEESLQFFSQELTYWNGRVPFSTVLYWGPFIDEWSSLTVPEFLF